MVTGELEAAKEMLHEARRLLDELATLEPANRRWSAAGLGARLEEAVFARRNGDLSQASSMIAVVRPQLERLVAGEPSSRVFARWLTKARLLEARLWAGNDPVRADGAANQAVAATEVLFGSGRAISSDVGEGAQACVVAGDLAARAGDLSLARQRWLRADELVRPRLDGSCDWQLLDPAARTAAALGRIEDARLIVEKLRKLGYVPLDPWPRTIAPGAEGTVP